MEARENLLYLTIFMFVMSLLLCLSYFFVSEIDHKRMLLQADLLVSITTISGFLIVYMSYRRGLAWIEYACPISMASYVLMIYLITFTTICGEIDYKQRQRQVNLTASLYIAAAIYGSVSWL